MRSSSAPDDWVAAFLAVPGYFPAFARGRLEGLHPARADLVPSVRLSTPWSAGIRALAVERREEARSGARRRHSRRHQAQERRLRGVVQGLKTLTRDDVPDMYDPALVELSLEICADAMTAAPVPAPRPICEKLSRVSGAVGAATLPDRSAQGQPAPRPHARKSERTAMHSEFDENRARSDVVRHSGGENVPAAGRARRGRESTGMAFLKRANGETAGQIIELKPDRIIIGRSPEHCHVVLDPNGVSRRHAEIYRKGEDFFLADLNSRNLTKVNNAKVIPGIDHRLVAGRPDQYLRRRVPVLPAASGGRPLQGSRRHHDRHRGREPGRPPSPHARRLTLERHGEHGQARGQAQGHPRDRPQPLHRAQDRHGRAQDPRFAHGAFPPGRTPLPGARRPGNQAARPQGVQVPARPRSRSSRPSSRPTRSR